MTKDAIKIFESNEFGKVRTLTIDNEPWFIGKDVAEILGYSNPQKAIRDHIKDNHKTVNELFTVNGTKGILIDESGLYSLIMKSKLSSAERFQEWVTSKVLPEIRKTGSYIVDSEQAGLTAVEKVLSKADKDVAFLIQTMAQRQYELCVENENLKKELTYKEDVIIGLVDDIDLATKRQRLVQIVKHTKDKNYANRWNLLYGEFERKYHLDLNYRFNRDKDQYKPKIKNKMDYIDRAMNKVDSFYELACKVFENDVEQLKTEWFDTVSSTSKLTTKN